MTDFGCLYSYRVSCSRCRFDNYFPGYCHSPSRHELGTSDVFFYKLKLYYSTCWCDVDLVDRCLKMYPVNILFFPTQELVTIVKDLKGQLNEIKGTNHTRRFQTLRDELKKYCHAIDFNETVALSKLRALIEEARLSKAEETAKITALLDRLTFSKQVSRWTSAPLFSDVSLQKLR